MAGSTARASAGVAAITIRLQCRTHLPAPGLRPRDAKCRDAPWPGNDRAIRRARRSEATPNRDSRRQAHHDMDLPVLQQRLDTGPDRRRCICHCVSRHATTYQAADAGRTGNRTEWISVRCLSIRKTWDRPDARRPVAAGRYDVLSDLLHPLYDSRRATTPRHGPLQSVAVGEVPTSELAAKDGCGATASDSCASCEVSAAR
jgi:hypothetical protein